MITHSKSRSAITVLAFAALALIVLSFTTTRAAGPWYVAPGGNDGNTCLSTGSPCATINGAIGKAIAGDTVKVATGVYTSKTGNEVVLIDKSITLSGGWNIDFTTQSDMSTIDGENNGYRGLMVTEGSVATISRFIIQNGWNSAITRYAGGILNDGNLIVENSIIRDNGSDYAIYNRSLASMTLNNTLVVSNHSGGIKNDGTLTINHSSISDNLVRGIENSSIVNINNSAIDNNAPTMPTSGAGILNNINATLILNNSTVSYNNKGNGNIISNNGGGIYSAGATAILNNSTVSFNKAGATGGIFCGYTQCNMTLRNTIVANNSGAATWSSPDCVGFISEGYNLIGNTTGCTFTPGPGDLSNINAGLFSLIGSPGYHPLLAGSPAINAGNPAGCTDHLGNPLNFDQRGAPRVGRCDIGSYEYDPANDPIHYVSLPIVFRNYCPDFFDNFSNPASGWAVGEDDFVRSEYLNGEYRVLSKQAGYYYLFSSPSCDRENYLVEVDAHWVGTPGASYGLIFGILGDFDQFYLFEINTDFQEYDLLRFDPSNVYTVVDWTASTAIHSGTASNHLKVTRSGTQIVLEVNGVVLGTWADGNITGLTGVGLVTSPYDDVPSSDARFDNFSVTKFPGVAVLARSNEVKTGWVEGSVHRENRYIIKRSWKK